MSILLVSFFAVSVFGAFYWVLAAIPFTYQMVILEPMLPSVQLAGQIYLPLQFILALAVLIKIKSNIQRKTVITLLVAFTFVSGFALLNIESLSENLRQTVMILHGGFMALAGAAVAFDRLKTPGAAKPASDLKFDLRILLSLLATSALLMGIFGYSQNVSMAGTISLLTVMLVMFPVLVGVSRLLSLFTESARAERSTLSVFYFVCIYWFISKQVLPAFSAEGWSFKVFALTVAFGSVGLGFGDTRKPSGTLEALAKIAVVAVAAVISIRVVTEIDWNLLGQKIILFSAALSLFFQFNKLFSTLLNTKWSFKKAPATVLFAAFWIFPVVGAGTLRYLPEWSPANVAESFSKDLLYTPVIDFDDLYFLLQRSSNLATAKNLKLPDLQNPTGDTAGKLARISGPDIFVFVIDSLRRDYVGAYNRDVTFTPALNDLAEDSFVFQNAFTRYGGTGLSEASLWAGAMVPHQSYPPSYAALNSLEKLLIVSDYKNFILRDSILKQIISPALNYTEIVSPHSEICKSVADLKIKLDDASITDAPVFAYMQPQNMHVSVLNTSEVEATTDVKGFHSLYASALKEADTCLGSFISYLKTTGRYNKSIIVVTSDHGDSLGEDGRFGHAYTLFPEIVRIPLILHLPVSMTSKYKPDLNGVVFQTDITPTLYDLLGYTLQTDKLDIRGKSLLSAPRPSNAEYMLVSSYGPVFALLSENGYELKIFDGINLKEHAFYLSPDQPRPVIWSAFEIKESVEILKQKINEWNDFYGVKIEQR